jgi:sterol desaturase/sphingolipid hydroxylase (fatty acid hydroxylase superfamily)
MQVHDPSPQRIRLFRSEHLESLTLMPQRVFVTTWAVLLVAIVWTGWGTASPLAAIGLVAGGLFVWSLFEYALHRYVLHWELGVPAVQWFVFLIHGNHHDKPNDAMRNMMPLVVSLPVAALIWAACLMLAGKPGTWLFLGFIGGYVTYDLIHYACHQRPMRGRLAAALKRHHMRHHHVDDGGNFAISAIFWDRVFGSRITSLRR